MPSVTDLVDDVALRQLADPETYSRGVELASRVRLWAFGPMSVSGRVESGEDAAVVLTATPSGLAWSCTVGDASPALICPHVIAVAVEARRRAPKRRR